MKYYAICFYNHSNSLNCGGNCSYSENQFEAKNDEEAKKKFSDWSTGLIKLGVGHMSLCPYSFGVRLIKVEILDTSISHRR